MKNKENRFWDRIGEIEMTRRWEGRGKRHSTLSGLLVSGYLSYQR